jgi:hypothetical protein
LLLRDLAHEGTRRDTRLRAARNLRSLGRDTLVDVAPSTPFEERVARNEALFREVNENVQQLAERFSTPSDVPAGFVCECADDTCTARVDVPLEVYEQVRQDPRRFVVLPGHVLPEIERVVEEADRYVVVEKTTPTAVKIVERHDPRS